MAKTYRVNPLTRLVNLPFLLLAKRGLGADYRYVLTVRGRRTGRLYSTPVDVMETDGVRWLVAPYGEVNWVRNARASGEVTLRRGRRDEIVKVTEVPPDVAAPVLRTYLKQVPITRPYFDVSPDSPDEAFAHEALRHPVFRIEAPVSPDP